MYRGITAHHNVPRVKSYADAQRAIHTKMQSKVASIYERSDGAIAFRLYQTDVVVSHSTEEVEVDNYGTRTTSGFAEHFLPIGIHLHYPSTRCGVTGGSNIISYCEHADGAALLWEDRYHICQGDAVRFQPHDNNLWKPDPDTCYDITLPMGVDRGKARDLAKRLHFKEFESWLSVAPLYLEAAGDPVEHDEWDIDECMNALEKRDWRQAAMHLPLVKEGAFGNGDRMRPLPIRTSRWDEHVTMTSFAKMKTAIWDWKNLLDVETRKTWARSEFDRRMAKVRELKTLGVSTHGLGPMI